MVGYPFRGLTRPMGTYKEILDYTLARSPVVKPVDLCCGLGYGKTILGVQLACLAMDDDPRHVLLFFEPDWDRINKIFLPAWEKYVPPELYTHDIGKRCMIWHNGARLYYMPRVITGAKERARGRTRGIETSGVIDDETAIGFDLEQYQNTFARIRLEANQRFYVTLTTPLVGPYARFLKRGGNRLFKGRTRDNHYLLLRDPDYEKRQRANMSEQQARRELDGELVALEGRIWRTCEPNVAWPKGNRNDIWTSFRPDEPWWLFCDFGSATGSYVVVQAMNPIYRGHEMYNGELVWVAVADLCPSLDASASRAFQRLKTEFGTPVAVTGGADINTRSNTDGSTISKFATNIFGPSVQIFPCNESIYNKQLQFDSLSRLMCTTIGDRRFTIARNFVSLDTESNRGVREMIDEDQYPPIEKRRINEILPKNKDNIVQHTRDALLMGAVAIMDPPDWAEDHNPPA
jgi:hypothetical protein